VQTDGPAFTPGEVTLMDFRLDQGDGLHFTYVLPFTERRALVGDTYVSSESVAPARRRASIALHLADRYHVHRWEVVSEERGRIAMGTARHDPAPSPRITAVGTAGGAVRASSGYAFVRLQRHCAAVAGAVAQGLAPPARLSHLRHDELDRVFLHALARDPQAFPEHFRRMVARVPPDVFARFMNDSSTVRDELHVIAALPKLPFVAAALRSHTTGRRPLLRTQHGERLATAAPAGPARTRSRVARWPARRPPR